MNKLAKFCAAVACLVSTSSQAQGVEQTPEGAERFLATVMKQYAVSGHPGLYNDYNSLDISYRMLDAVGEGPCLTRLEGAINQFTGNDGTGSFGSGAGNYEKGGQDNLARVPVALAKWSLKGFPYVVDWSKVASVKQSDRHKLAGNYGAFPSKQAVQLTTSDAGFSFILPSEELATRVAYAMEFLRLNCDKTAETGF
jgi:hypothetical protein